MRTLLLLTLLAVPIESVLACGCRHPQTVDEAKNASLIFKGTVQSVQKHIGPGRVGKDGFAYGDFSSQTVQFKIIEVLRGTEMEEIKVIFNESGANSCDLQQLEFAVGDNYLISVKEGSFGSTSVYSSELLPQNNFCDLRERI